MSEAGISVSGVSFSYQSRQVLHDVSINVPGRQFLAILGPNGSGKTTLLKAMSGFISPAAGEIRLSGKNIRKMALVDLAREMAVVTQNPSFDFPFTVEEYVALGRAPHLRRFEKLSPQDMRVVLEAAESAGVVELFGRPVDELSGGEQKRVAIARALAQAAEVLLLDEPTANLDINYQVSVMALLLTLVRRKGTTVVTVLHDLNLAASYCDAVVLMDKGRVHAAGKPRDVITRENVRAVYGPGFEVTMSATTGRPFVLPSAVRSQAEKRFLAFVIGGGGSAAPLLNNLVRERVNVSLGVINAGDADWFTCQALGVPVIEEEPFSPVRKESLDRAMVCALEADAVVIAPTPFGPGNVSSLGVAEKALAAEKTVVIVAPRTIGQRDYTGGEAERRVSALIADGALTALDEDEALNILRRCGKWDERY